MANTTEGISVKALYQSWRRRRQSNDKKQQEAHAEVGQARQARDVVGHGNELSTNQLRRTA